jgi:hypothetical protein
MVLLGVGSLFFERQTMLFALLITSIADADAILEELRQVERPMLHDCWFALVG